MGYSDRPRRGQYGDTTQRCAWCGKETLDFDRCLVGGVCGRNYCSFSCRAAGDYYYNIACVSCFSVVFLVLFISGLTIIGSDSFLFFTLVFLGLAVTCGWGFVFYGRGYRKEM